jgi:hypothetical protein
MLNIMSNPQTYYITMNGSSEFQDLSGIFQPLSLGTQYPTATGFQLSTGEDLNQIFADITSGSPLGYDVNFKSVAAGNLDLSQIFAKYNPIIYTITNQSNMNVTLINYSGYTALIFENTTTPTYPNAATNATCNITFNTVKTINILVVGGGSGGAGGYNDPSDITKTGSGGGAGGAGYIYTSFTNVTGSAYSIQVGGGGPGRKVTNAGTGAEAGLSGDNSSFSLVGLSLIGGYSQPGFSGSFTGSSYSGGGGGASTSSLNNTGGGGGGGGGGANDVAFLTNGSPNANPTAGHLNISFNAGNLGTAGGTTTTSNGGDGGNSYSNTISPPFLSCGSIYYGNGGGGGSYNNGGGKAGFTSGGNGYGAATSNGEDATYGLQLGNYYYGNGGGGGATIPSPDNYGGNGGNGVVMLWWLN